MKSPTKVVAIAKLDAAQETREPTSRLMDRLMIIPDEHMNMEFFAYMNDAMKNGGLLCWNCGLPGHFRTQCPDPQKPRPPYQGTPGAKREEGHVVRLGEVMSTLKSLGDIIQQIQQGQGVNTKRLLELVNQHQVNKIDPEDHALAQALIQTAEASSAMVEIPLPLNA